MQRIAKVVVTAAVALGLTAPSAYATSFISGFSADVWHDAAQTQVETQAGSTPDTGVTDFTITNTAGMTSEQIKNITVDLPPGLISNPAATPLCSQTDFGNNNCAADTQIGTVNLTASGTPVSANVYNLVPADGNVSDFGFQAAGVSGLPVGTPLVTHIIGGVADTTDYHLFFRISNVPNGINISHSRLTFFGDPAAKTGHGTAAPFIRLPTACAGPQTTTLTIETYSGNTYTATSTTNDHASPTPNLIGATGCDQLPFTPSLSMTPSTTQRDAPVGATVDIGVPWQSDPTMLAQSHVKNTVVTLPPGMTISPSAANGLKACTDDQFGQGTSNSINCPVESKVGTATIKTPVLQGANPGDPAELTGAVYLGQPLPDNPYRLFVDAASTRYGLDVRLEGTVTPDPKTGQLTTTFANTPQVPFTDFILNLNPGPNATLASPLACGQAKTTSDIAPYSGNADATPNSSFTVDQDGKGGACPDATPFNLGFVAGSTNLAAGAFSPFGLTVTRDDGEQFLSGLTVTQPPGLLGIIQSVPLCDDANAAAGTCPDASRVGTSTVASGPGSAPFSLSGPVYLAGPYGGGPFSLVIAIRALAGPFDLGTVVVRAAIKVDPTDSHLVIDTPSLPTILQGIPLRLRSVNVSIDRANFLFNPTNCGPLAVAATLKSSDGATQNVSAPFQATGCDALPYAPQMTASSTAAKRGDPAGLTVSLSQAPGEANTRSVSVKLPGQLGARLSTVNQACPEATFMADPTSCNAGSKVGTVLAVTPLLAQPLDGTVYLEAHQPPHLPTLEAVLQGSGITVDLSGNLDLSNGIKSTFQTVPDVPITTFRLTLPPSASNSALTATADLCSGTLPLVATILGQNGKQVDVNSTVGVAGCGIAITKATVNKRAVTLKLLVPSAGTVAVSGKGIGNARKSVGAAGATTMRVKLSKVGLKALRRALHQKKKSRRKLTIAIRAAFTPKNGQTAGGQPVRASSATRKVTFKK